MDITKMTDEALKAKGYDFQNELVMIQRNLQVINQELASRQAKSKKETNENKNEASSGSTDDLKRVDETSADGENGTSTSKKA